MEGMRGLHRGILLQISICKRRRVGIPQTGYRSKKYHRMTGTMQRHEYRKTNRGGEDNDGCSGEERIPPTLELCSLTYGGGGKKARRHQMLTVDLLQEA
ncbi:unnamed protein product [Prunus armeniaca]|uniref:Uncharacterized protein n=1 Tax=Prunus armeniaca TaxID=36596 RepID=A0A6J5VW38_PRUAR|nr:unnamed protein product [Prunus armeniaca]